MHLMFPLCLLTNVSILPSFGPLSSHYAQAKLAYTIIVYRASLSSSLMLQYSSTVQTTNLDAIKITTQATMKNWSTMVVLYYVFTMKGFNLLSSFNKNNYDTESRYGFPIYRINL